MSTNQHDEMAAREVPRPTTAAAVFAGPAVETEVRSTGELIVRSAIPLGAFEATTGEWLRGWAERTPDRAFLAERDADGSWTTVTYADASRAAHAVAQALLDRSLSATRPVVVLSGNAIDHALLMLGCYLVGVPITPVSVAYSLMCADPGKVQDILDVMRPGLVFADDGDTFRQTLASADVHGAEIVVSHGGDDHWTRFDALTQAQPTGAVDAAFAATGPDTVAKVLFTSGSTGRPKGVPNTHRMLCSNQKALGLVWPFVRDEPPVLVDWLPWSHTFGGNHNFHLVLRAGGTLYIDAGRPAPDLFETTLRNVVDVSPTIYLNVPVGHARLVEALEADADAAHAFFRRLRLIMYAAAALPQDTWDRLTALAQRFAPGEVALTTSWGATETAPVATTAHFPLDAPGTIGVPIPGSEVKLAPTDGRLELRVRGPNVASGYLTGPLETSQPEGSFDDEGFYRTGDAGRLVDRGDPSRGIIFDGRIKENFKLATGTWVHTAAVRMAVLQAAAPLVQDVVVTGEGRNEIGVLVWPTPTGEALGDGLATELRRRLGDTGSTDASSTSHNIRRLLVLSEPPSIDAGEITDKGYINQRAVLARRAALVEALHDDTRPTAGV